MLARPQKHLIIALAVGILLMLLYSYRLTTSFNYDNDFGRDIVDILAIANGDIRLLGPKLSFGGIHASPWYYYLFVPVVYIAPLYPEMVLYAGAALSASALALAFWLLLKVHDLFTTSLVIWGLAFSPYMVFSARNPGNAFTYIPLLALGCVSIYVARHRPRHFFPLVAMGFTLFGLSATAHPVSLIATLPWMLYAIVYGMRTRVLRPIHLIILAVLFSFSFVPNVLFEVTHDFVQFKNTFIDRSYLQFTENRNLPSTALKPSKNIIENALFVTTQLAGWATHTGYFVGALVLIFLRDRRKKTQNHATLIFVLLSTTSFALLILLMRSQYAFHYLLPVAVTLTVALLLYIGARSSIILMLLVSIMTITMYTRVVPWYQPSVRPFGYFRQAVERVDAPLGAYKSTPLAILMMRPDTNLAPHGYEYRYFLALRGYTLLDISLYKDASRLIIFDEVGDTDVSSIKSWEMSEFSSGKDLRVVELIPKGSSTPRVVMVTREL